LGPVMFALLVALKVMNVISLSWLWVFAPIWVPFIIMVIAFIGALVILVCSNIKEMRW
jgi:hypothetical protein